MSALISRSVTQMPSFNPRAELDALKRILTSIAQGGALRKEDLPTADLKKDVKEQVSEQGLAERFLARPGDVLEVKSADGKVHDVWQVLESSTTRASQVQARSLRTGTTITIPARIFELKKFGEGHNVSVDLLPERYFVPEQEEDGSWTIKNVPIMACESRGKKLYDEAYLDRLVTTYWGDKQSVADKHGTGSEAHPYEPPVIIGHTSDDVEVRNDQREAVGYISAMWRAGKLLMANLGNITGEWLEKLRKGALPNRSCELKVKAGRIVALALLSEEPYFHMPQMRNFEAPQQEPLVFKYTYEGDSNMEQLQQLLDVFKQGASIVEGMLRNEGGGGAAPPVGNDPTADGAVASPPPQQGEDPSKTQQFKGGQTDPNAVESEGEGGKGTQGAIVGEEPKDTPSTDAKGPTETASSQSGPTGRHPNPDMKLSATEKAMQAQIDELKKANANMGKKLTFAVDHINGLTQEKQRLSHKNRLARMMAEGAPLGGAEGIDRHLNVLAKMSKEDAEKYVADLDALPKVQMLNRHSAAGGNGGEASWIDTDIAKHKADFERNPDRYNGSGMDSNSFAASQVLGEIMADAGADFDEEGA